MFLDQQGQTVFYMRRLEGRDTLFMFRPDLHRDDSHAILSVSHDTMMAWPAGGRCVILCDRWPQDRPGLRFKFFDMAKISYLLDRQAVRIHELLTDVPLIAGLTSEHRPLPTEVFELLRDQYLVFPGKAAFGDEIQRPALYVFDGRTVTCRTAPLPFLKPTDLPAAVYQDPAGTRLWLAMGDSHHLFVLDASTFELVGDVVWPVDEQSPARLAFHPLRPEVWVCTLTGVRVLDRNNFRLVREIPCATEVRWHRGERIKGMLGALTFSPDGRRAFVARPLHGDVLEINGDSCGIIKSHPVFVDPLELAIVPGQNRLYLQGMRAGQVSWMPLSG